MTDQTLTLFKTLFHGLQVTVAYFVFTLLLLLVMANWALPYFNVLKPQIMLAVVFYWSLYRPTLMPPPVVFAMGLILDLMHPFLPMGTHAASYLFIQALVRGRRRFLMGQPFVIVWAAFVLAVIFDMAWKTGVVTVLTSYQFGILAVLLNGFFTVLLFPLLVVVLVMVHRLLPSGRGMIIR